MARRPRLSGERLYHHIYAWGNNRQAIFLNHQHYATYLDYLRKYSNDYRVDIIAYALMQTHIHLFVYDLRGRVSDFMNSLHGEYAQYFNRMTGGVGHVFGERFNNKVVQANEYGLWLSRYIHRQAVEAGLVRDPKDYPWTSYHGYLGETSVGFLKPEIILSQFGNDKQCFIRYKEFVEGTENGPVAWDSKSVIVVGDEEFKQGIRECEAAGSHEDPSDEEILVLIASRFKVKPELLITPHGWEEKRLRRMLIRYLVDEIGLKPARIAQLCHISRMAVQKAFLKKL